MPEQVLLLDTVLPVATIERVGDATIELRVHLVIRIEQVELDTTYVSYPKSSVNHEVGVRYVYYNLVAFLVENALDRQTVKSCAS